ncbi:MAG: hypothetical protein GEU90_18900 [Gemmatimonas sp.]|nr:hypothetical protein [Gemmatimonas sp.]
MPLGLPGADPTALRPQVGGIKRFPVFISYGEEAKDLKRRVKRLVEEAIDSQLTHDLWQIHIPVIDWREIAAQAAPRGGKTNDLFVKWAGYSSATIVLLFDRMPPGTAEELRAAMDEGIELKVFWIRRRRWLKALRPRTEVDRFLEQQSDDFKYLEIEDPDSEQAWIEITANLVSVLLRVVRGQTMEPLFETRGNPWTS